MRLLRIVRVHILFVVPIHAELTSSSLCIRVHHDIVQTIFPFDLIPRKRISDHKFVFILKYLGWPYLSHRNFRLKSRILPYRPILVLPLRRILIKDVRLLLTVIVAVTQHNRPFG